MGDLTFTVKDLIIALSAVGPGVVAFVSFWVRLNRWQAEACARDKSQTEGIIDLGRQIQGLREEMQGIDKDQRFKIGRLHDRVNVNESAVAEIKGWQQAHKGKG